MNNRKTLLNILREHTGKSNNYILNNLDKINLYDIFFKCPSELIIGKFAFVDPVNLKDFKEFKAFADLQKAVDADLY